MSLSALSLQSRRVTAGVVSSLRSGSIALSRHSSTGSTPTFKHPPGSLEDVSESLPSSSTIPLGMKLSFPSAPGLDEATISTLESMPIPRNLMALYMRPLRRPAPHGIPVCNLQLRSYSARNLEFFADFAMRAAYYLGLCAKGPVPLPRITERWTIPRSPFIFKKSQENFERVTVRRLIQIQDGNLETVQSWLAYLEKRSFHGIGMKANVWDQEDLGVLERMEELEKEADQMGGEQVRKLMISRQRARARPSAALKAKQKEETETGVPAGEEAAVNPEVIKEVERIMSELDISSPAVKSEKE